MAVINSIEIIHYKKQVDKIIFNLFIILTFLSCQPEKIDIPDTGRKIVINSLLTSDSLIGANITTSAYVFQDTSVNNSLSEITNAKAVIYENNTFLDSLSYNYSYKYHSSAGYLLYNYSSKLFYPKPGYQYKIKVDAFGKPEVTAITTIPNIVKIVRVDTSRVIISNPWYESNVDMIFDIVFNDPANEQNYYLIFMPTNGQVQDPAIEEYLYSGSILAGFAFSDKTFNGKPHVSRLIINGKDIGYPFWDYGGTYTPVKKVLYFKLYSITEDYFKYIQSLNLYYTNYNNPLAEPTQVFSNIQEGYGIFEGAGVSCDSIVFY